MSRRPRTFRIVHRTLGLLVVALSSASACGDGDAGARGGDSGSEGAADGGTSSGTAGSEAGQRHEGGNGGDPRGGGASGDRGNDQAGAPNGGASGGTESGARGGAESGASGTSAGDGGRDGSGVTAVRGIVTAFRPNLANLDERVPGALVSIDDGSERHDAVSDGNGFFEFTTISPGTRHRVKVSVDAAARRFHDGMPYGDWYGEVTAVAGRTTWLMPRLNLGCAIHAAVAANSETAFSTSGPGNRGCGAYDLSGQLVIPAGGLTRANGEDFSGEARLEFSPIWFPTIASGNVNFTSLAAMPPLVGVPQGEVQVEPMHTFAAADLRVADVQSGDPLVLKPGMVADLTLRGFRELTSEDDYSSWSFDPASGAWREEGTCTADSADAQLIHCEVKHFSWWNADGRNPAQSGGGGPLGTRCIFGGVLYQGEPLVGASVLATGNAGIIGAAQAQTDESGAFCAIGVSGNGAWDVQVRVENGREILSQTLSVSPGGVFGGDCSEPQSCSQAGVIELEASPAITVYGRLGLQVGAEEQPMPSGGFSFGRRVRAIGSPDEFGFIQLNLGEVLLDSGGGYEFDVPEAIVRIFFASPNDGECKTYPSPVPGEGERVEIADQFFVCGS